MTLFKNSRTNRLSDKLLESHLRLISAHKGLVMINTMVFYFIQVFTIDVGH